MKHGAYGESTTNNRAGGAEPFNEHLEMSETPLTQTNASVDFNGSGILLLPSIHTESLFVS